MFLTQKEGLKGNFIQTFSMKVSAKAIRTINKNGLLNTLKEAKSKGFITSY